MSIQAQFAVTVAYDDHGNADGEPARAVVSVTGEIDLATAPQLLQEVLEAINTPSDVVLDLRAVEFFDASGISVLVEAAAKADNAAVRLTLRAPSRPVCRVLEILGLVDAFWIEAPTAG